MDLRSNKYLIGIWLSSFPLVLCPSLFFSSSFKSYPHPSSICPTQHHKDLENPIISLTNRENSTFNVIDLELMSKALWDSDYKIMSLLLKGELPNLIPYGTDSSSELRLYDNNTITVFAPRDEAFRFELWMSVEYQVVLSKFDKEAIESGLVSKGLKMASCDCEAEYVVVSDVEDDDYQASASVNNVKVTRWNIYNDGHLIVHGVEDFFYPGFVYKNFLFWSKEAYYEKLQYLATHSSE